jgi:DNA-binding NtrC family response regulator
LDEIGDTSPSLQVKLLRVLQAGSVRRLGESAERPVDVRVVAATNRPLDQMVSRGEFREDLFFRLNVVHLHLPPLRERGEDLTLLLQANLARYCSRLAKDVRGFAPEAWDALTHYFFPGNIRELENIVHHAVLMADGSQVQMADLPPYLHNRLGLPAYGGSQPLAAMEVPREAWVKPVDAVGGAAAARPAFTTPTVDLGDGFLTLSEMEKQLIQATLQRLAGNQSLAARKLGISRSTLWRKMKEYGLEA